MPKLRVLVVDDAVVVRRILTDALSTDPSLEVHTAANGRIALAKVEQVQPDVITLDVEMPELDGLATLKLLRKTHPKLPVIMFSTLTERGATATLDAIAAGANDYVTKPANVGSVSTAISRVKDELIPKIKALCAVRAGLAAAVATTLKLPAAPSLAAPPPTSGPIDLIVIGVSTGGPNALSALLPMLPATLPVPIAIVQHMPPLFTRLLAERLATQSAIKVCEGAAGMKLAPGQAVIAPGGWHLILERSVGGFVAQLNQDPPENSCRPAVDVLFRSAVPLTRGRILGVVLTGMGSDGLRGCELIREAGGHVIVQDEASSVVWGMPGFVARAGLAHKVLPLDQIAGEITRIATQHRKAA